MGYTTEFIGSFKVTPTLRDDDKIFLRKLATTRRMARRLPEEYGIDGEFYVDGSGFCGQNREESIIDFNKPPSSQPGLWCQWSPNKSGTKIGWDGGEKFYNYEEWIKYLIDNILQPRGYVLNGKVMWVGEDMDDRGEIIIEDNAVCVVKYEFPIGDDDDDDDNFYWDIDELDDLD